SRALRPWRDRRRRVREAPHRPGAAPVSQADGGAQLAGDVPQHPFRFGVVAAQAGSGEDWAAKARRIESMGYSTLVMPDGVRHVWAPLPGLAAAAASTRSLRLGTYVIANDFRNPVLLAKEAATLDVISGGR